MSNLPLQNYSIPSKPLWIPNVDPLVISSIVLADSLAIDGTNGNNIDLTIFASTSALYLDVPNQPGFNSLVDLRTISSGVEKKELLIGVGGSSSNAFMSFASDGTTKASIAFVSSLQGQFSGGVTVLAQDGTALEVGADAVASYGPAGGVLEQLFTNSSNAYIRHLANNAPPYELLSQIHFNQANSSITLVAGPGNAIGVNVAGIGMNPGSNLPVVLQSGYLDMSNLAMSNVSSINGDALPTCVKSVAPLVPITNPFTFGSNAANFTIATFNDLEVNGIYRVGFSGSFACMTNVTPTADSYFLISGFSGGGGDAESICAVNANSIEQFGNIPGTLGAANAFYGCIFKPSATSWSIYANAGPNLNTDIEMFVGSLYLEKLL